MKDSALTLRAVKDNDCVAREKGARRKFGIEMLYSYHSDGGSSTASNQTTVCADVFFFLLVIL